MNNNGTLAVRQPITAATNENLCRDLRQAIKIINAECQQIDWDNQAFLNRVINSGLSNFEVKEGRYADN